MTIAEAMKNNEGFSENTTLVDSFGNTVKVPEGFKVASDSATDVTGGVVIEDVNHGATEGSQFVWIPVGTIYTNAEQTTYETIELGRYVFNEDGTINEGLSKTGPSDQLKINLADSYYFTEGLINSTTGNTHAKDISTFVSTAINSKGYYIARYEARTAGETARINENDPLGQITVKASDYVYNYVTQEQASTLSQEMYNSTNFTSDLVNSYAWDTAIVFIQKFDDRENKTREYSMQTSLNLDSDIGLAEKGTINEELQYQDKVCNIWDMSSNCTEWTTETCSDQNHPCTRRGGYYQYKNGCTSNRYYSITTGAYPNHTFRSILYL